jgi:hypothetical protein
MLLICDIGRERVNSDLPALAPRVCFCLCVRDTCLMCVVYLRHVSVHVGICRRALSLFVKKRRVLTSSLSVGRVFGLGASPRPGVKVHIVLKVR